MQSMKTGTALFDSVDPDWAWSAWKPSASESWDIPQAAHLYRRAGFGATRQTLEEAQHTSITTTIEKLLGPSPEQDAFNADSARLASSALAGNDPRDLGAWWLHAMFNSPSSCVEKMTLFWHGHFATGADKVKDAQLMLDQNQLFRTYALGNVSDLVHAVSKDPAMLIYLDSAVNRKAHPNENFARELMELFCLGEGNYTEKDVQELARCFTGWEVRRKQFRFNQYQHDTGMKKLLSADSIESGEEAVDTVLSNPHAPRFIVLKLFRFLVADEPQPPTGLLEPLTEHLRTSKWDISSVIRRMLGSCLLMSPLVRGRKVRSPIDWALNWMKACEITTNLNKLSRGLNDLGQALFYPPNVKGWDGGRAWINSSTLVARTNLVHQLLHDSSTRFASGDIDTFFRRQRVTSVESLIRWVEIHLLTHPLSKSAHARLVSAMDAAGGTRHLADCLVLAAALPEMQLA